MKKVILKDDKAVSPIIATILLVAITVVLAATLYTILGGYTTFLGISTPQASIQVNEVANNPPVYQMYVVQYGGNISLSEVQMVITTTNNSVYYDVLSADQPNASNVDGLWNISVKGPQYFGVSTVATISGIPNFHGDQNISQVRIVDLKTQGTIATFTMNQQL
ncbi:MAG: type IV pilin [Candidatus Thermoplasmatota archaeon]|jgi:flagellin-like protein|nr:type IV pilin [Candidatus Thermoplasmatota archaeon]MCL5955479.1 type IV pilin [Candidatus Thermoplasmatota archaeon]